MSRLPFSLSRVANLHEAQVPSFRLAHPTRAYRRRLDDALEAVFQRACAANQMDAAGDVLAVLEKWHQLRAAKYGKERRIDSRAITAMRAELVRLRSRIS